MLGVLLGALAGCGEPPNSADGGGDLPGLDFGTLDGAVPDLGRDASVTFDFGVLPDLGIPATATRMATACATCARSSEARTSTR